MNGFYQLAINLKNVEKHLMPFVVKTGGSENASDSITRKCDDSDSR